MHPKFRVCSAVLLLAASVAVHATAIAQDVRVVVGEANALLRQRKYDEAIAKYDDVLRLKPDDYGPMNDRGICWENKGELDRALADFNGALQLKPTFALALWNRGRIYQKRGDAEAALNDWGAAIQSAPRFVPPYFSRADLYMRRQDYASAIMDYSHILEFQPKNAAVYRLRGNAFLQMDDWDRGIRDNRQAVRMWPALSGAYFKKLIETQAQHPEVTPLFDAIGWLYATSGDAKTRDGKKAVLYAKAACEKTQYKYWAHLGTLAAACAEAEDFENAVTWAYRAADLAPENEKPSLLARAKQFENHQPFRDVVVLSPPSPRRDTDRRLLQPSPGPVPPSADPIPPQSLPAPPVAPPPRPSVRPSPPSQAPVAPPPLPPSGG
jgi:tetratricopeptide (TPR) repeat protein